MKILILCLLTARTGLGLGQEQYNDTITEYLEKHPDITIANDKELAIAAKNLAANEDKINAQNEKYSKGEANYSEKPGPTDTKSNEQMTHLGYKPSNESIERINTPEALSYFGKLKEKYNREDIPDFWDSVEQGWVTSAKEQGSCGSCYIFAAFAAAETALIKAGADLKSMDLSEQWSLNCIYQDYGGCGGGNAKEVGKFLVSRGVLIKESDLPYEGDSYETECKEDSTPYWIPGYKLTNFHRIQNSDEDIMRSIMESGSVVMTVTVHDNDSGNGFWHYSSGVFDDCPYGSTEQGTHQVVAVGWGTENGVDYWLIKNSWGDGWGENGFMKFKRGTCGANKWLMTFVAEETPICSKESPCETGKGHCENNESCLSGHCGLKNCPSVDVILQPRSNLANCCFEAYQPVDIAIKTKCGEKDGTEESLSLKLCQSQQQCKGYWDQSFDMNLLKYTKCNEGFYGVPQCCSFNSFTLPNGNTDCEATDNYKLSDLGDCAGMVFDFDKPIDGTLTLSEDIEGKRDGWRGEWIKIVNSGSSKRMKCQIEGGPNAGLGFTPFTDGQLWILDGEKLQDKRGLWKRGELQKWKFTSKGDLIRIENIDKKQVLGITNDGKVELENIEDDKDGQLWKKGEPDQKGYFSLKNSGVPKFLTFVSSLTVEDPMKQNKQLDIVCATDNTDDSTSAPCIDIWKTKNCIKQKKKGRCNQTPIQKNCKKTCEEC